MQKIRITEENLNELRDMTLFQLSSVAKKMLTSFSPSSLFSLLFGSFEDLPAADFIIQSEYFS
jgi:hypothetical protein